MTQESRGRQPVSVVIPSSSLAVILKWDRVVPIKAEPIPPVPDRYSEFADVGTTLQILSLGRKLPFWSTEPLREVSASVR